MATFVIRSDEIKTTLAKISEAFGKLDKERLTRRELGPVILVSLSQAKLWTFGYSRPCTNFSSHFSYVFQPQMLVTYVSLFKHCFI